MNNGRTMIRKLRSVLKYLMLILLVFAFSFPFIWMFSTAIKGPLIAYQLPPTWWGFTPQWGNFVTAWTSKSFGSSFLHTITIGLGSVALTIVLAVPAAYALSRNRLKFSDSLASGLLSIRFLPEILFIIPLYVLFSSLNLLDTQLGMMLVFQIINLPFGIWLIRSFMEEAVPIELEESARINGCSSLGVLLKVVVPLIAPGIASVAILSFVRVWTNLLFPLTLARGNARTIAVTIANFKGYGSFNVSVLAAASLLAIAPQMLFVMFTQRYIVRGLTAGATKG